MEDEYRMLIDPAEFQKKVLDYISATRLKPERLLSCEYVLRLEKYREEDEFEV